MENNLVFGQLPKMSTQQQAPSPSSSIMDNYSKAYNNGLPYFFQDGDEDEVKRPMNSFLLWAKIMRKKYATENPNMHNAEISKLLGKIWNSMTTKDKRPFVEQAEKLRVLHMRTYPNYRYAPKRRKERRSPKMISPEVAAALHTTLFDVKNIISEQLSQNQQMLGQNLKSYGYLRNAFQQKACFENEQFCSNDTTFTRLDSSENSPDSQCSTHSPSPSSDYCNTSKLTEVSNTDNGGNGDESYLKSEESLTLHYYPNANSLHNNELINSFTKPQHMNYELKSTATRPVSPTDEASGREDDEEAIGKEFSCFLNSRINFDLMESDGNDEYFWSDIIDIMQKGSL